MTEDEFRKRSAEDFRLMVLCELKGDMAMYSLLKDRDLEAERARRDKKDAKPAERRTVGLG